MAERDKYGDIIFTEEEGKELRYRLTHPDIEALARRDAFLEELDKRYIVKFNDDGSIECFEREE